MDGTCGAGHLLSDQARIQYGRLVWAFIRAGWNPPRPSARILARITDDMEKVEGHGATLDLSPQQIAVVQCASLGFTRAGAAQELGVGIETVKMQWGRINRKLGTKTQAHAVAVCIRKGIIDPPSEAATDLRDVA